MTNHKLKATLQIKNGMYYCVISYKDQKTNKWKLKWKTTKVLAKQGNKKKAKDKFDKIISDFEKELNDKEQKDMIKESSYKRRIEENKNISFLNFINDSIEEFKPRIAVTTYEKWKDIANKRIANYFKPYKSLDKIINIDIKRNTKYDTELTISQVSQFDIEDFYKWLYDCNLKGSTVCKYHVLLSLVFKRAERLKIFTSETNPIKDVQKPVSSPYTADFYSAQELNELFNLIKGEKIELLVYITALLGLRRSEAIGITWSSIDFENKYITIKHTVTKVIGCGENQQIQSKEFTKNSDIRTYPLSKEIEDRLLQHKRKIEENKKFFGNSYVKQTEEYVFVNEKGELLKPDYVTKRLNKVLKKNGKLKVLKYHSLRHSCASILCQQNVNVKQIQQYLGHKSIKSSSIYQHLNFSSQQFSMGILSEQLEKAKRDENKNALV